MDEGKWSELLGLVEALGNVSLACKRMRVSRGLYYKWRKLKKIQLNDHSDSKPQRRIHPQSIPDQVKLEIRETAQMNPEWGCNRISYFLELKGIRVSVSTVHTLLRKLGLKKGIRKKSDKR